MKKLYSVILICLLAGVCTGQTASATYSVKFSNAIISRWPNTINDMTGKGWEYSNSIILHGMEKVYNDTPDINYLSYIKKYVESYVDSSGNVTLSSTLDNIHPALLCLFLYQKTGLTKFKTAATNVRNFLNGASSTYPKTPNGGYWHKNSSAYTNVMMLDGIYMAHPFLVRYGKLFNDVACYDTATSQALLLASYVYDNTIHLARHAWNYDKSKAWANAGTGVSSEVWSRAMGWYVMSLVDILKYLPSTHSKYNSIKALLANLAIGIQNTQDPTTGLWYQVMNKQDSAGNYLETSGSAMFVYALKVAVDSGWISGSYLTVAQKGWAGLKANSIGTAADGKPSIKNFAPAMSVQNNYTAYVSSPNTAVTTPTATHPHGYAAILMAASVMEFPLASTLPVRFTGFTAAVQGALVQLDWQAAESGGRAYYIIQRSEDGSRYSEAGRLNASGSPAYHWTDNAINADWLYYRIVAVEADGTPWYSTVQAVRCKTAAPGFTVSPNPLNGRTATLRCKDIAPGSHLLYFINNAGITVACMTLHIDAGEESRVLTLPAAVRSGLYYIKLETGDEALTRNLLVY